MMYGPEKSDLAIVARKPANKAEQPSAERTAAEPNAAELVERRAGTKGNAGQQSTCRTQSRANVSKALERIRKVFCRHIPKVGAVCGKAARTVLCGGRAMKRTSLPLLVLPVHVAPRANSVTARSISPASRTSTGLNSTPNDGATIWTAPNCPIPEATAGSRRTAARVTRARSL
jgi:hypothetical protein